jgi:hypothetical protein
VRNEREFDRGFLAVCGDRRRPCRWLFGDQRCGRRGRQARSPTVEVAEMTTLLIVCIGCLAVWNFVLRSTFRKRVGELERHVDHIDVRLINLEDEVTIAYAAALEREREGNSDV